MTRPNNVLTALCLVCGRPVYPWEEHETAYDPEDPMSIQSFTHTVCLEEL